ncbi:MAG: N-acetyltransferase [Novosphingobium sp.]|nr:N-acetyltransferase [Novosphingobium sp.]
MPDVTITRHEQNGRGAYRAHVAGSRALGRLTWSEENGVRIAEHTVVPPEIGGLGVGARLVEALIEDARAQGFKVKPACSYVAAQFDRHPEWAELRA